MPSPHDEEDTRETLEQNLYSAHAFAAVAIPVSITMILASLAVVYINDGSNGFSSGAGRSGIPLVFVENAGESDQTKFLNALVNALAIIGAIIGATMVLVFLYYFRFMKVLIGWLILSTSLLLAFSSGLVIQEAIQLLNVPVDAISYSFVFYNFAIVGVTAIFYGKGVPDFLSRAYLVVISVTMAWILLRFLPEWTCWLLLAVLAFYDLCAVLTPIGPLKWLVGIMQTRNEPLPGLLYEARFTNTVTANAVGVSPRMISANRNDFPGLDGGGIIAASAFQNMQGGGSNNSKPILKADDGMANSHEERDLESGSNRKSPSNDLIDAEIEEMMMHAQRNGNSRELGSSSSSARVNLATSSSTTNGILIQHQEEPLPISERHQQALVSYNPDDFYEDEDHDKSIKLGLGDFVFYSLLCARASLVSFTTFIAVYLVVIFGLALTLLLLALYRMALPALPISILLGLVFFFAVQAVMVPFVLDFSTQMAFA